MENRRERERERERERDRERERERERNLPSLGGCNLLPSSLLSTSASSSPNLLIPREEGGRDELKRKRSKGRYAVRADLVFFLMRAP